jgi:hypothetical protein
MAIGHYLYSKVLGSVAFSQASPTYFSGCVLVFGGVETATSAPVGPSRRWSGILLNEDVITQIHGNWQNRFRKA